MVVEAGAIPRHTRGPPNGLTRFRHMSIHPVVGHDASATKTSSSTSHIALETMF